MSSWLHFSESRGPLSFVGIECVGRCSLNWKDHCHPEGDFGDLDKSHPISLNCVPAAQVWPGKQHISDTFQHPRKGKRRVNVAVNSSISSLCLLIQQSWFTDEDAPNGCFSCSTSSSAGTKTAEGKATIHVFIYTHVHVHLFLYSSSATSF